MIRVLPAVAVVALTAISPLSAQPVKTQQYEAVSQPDQIDSTTQAIAMPRRVVSPATTNRRQ